MKAEHNFDSVMLPSGSTLDLGRKRSDGRLTEAELAYCRAQGLPLGYDPVQQGWVLLSFEDDIDPAAGQAVPRLADRRPRDPLEGSAQALDTGNRRQSAGPAHEPHRLEFRPWDVTDAPVFRALLDAPEVWRYLPEAVPTPLTGETATTLIEISNAAPHHEVRAVLLDGRPVGQVRHAHAPGRNGDAEAEAEVSYWLGRDFWGKGIGSGMVAAYVRDVFARKPALGSLFARIHRENVASARIARRAGFHAEGPAPDDPAFEIFRLRRRPTH